jgi:hypothetical protein
MTPKIQKSHDFPPPRGRNVFALRKYLILLIIAGNCRNLRSKKKILCRNRKSASQERDDQSRSETRRIGHRRSITTVNSGGNVNMGRAHPRGNLGSDSMART